MIPYFKENKNLNDCVEKLKMETRRYAKRQITWFKRDSEINWIYIDEYNSFEEIYSYAKAVIERGLLMDKLLFRRILMIALSVLAVVYAAYLLISTNFKMYPTEMLFKQQSRIKFIQTDLLSVMKI